MTSLKPKSKHPGPVGSGQAPPKDELVEAAWHEVLARITLGLAHDINNALTGALSLSDLLLSQAGPNHPHREALGLIKQSAQKASGQVRQLYQLHQSKAGQPEYVDAVQVARESLELLRKVLPPQVLVETEFAPGPLAVYTDVWGLRLVVLHLILSAVDAMPAGGTLLLQVAAQKKPSHSIKLLAGDLPDSPLVCLTFQHAGTGAQGMKRTPPLAPADAAKGATRATNRVPRIIKWFLEQNGGAFAAASKAEKGTRVDLWLAQADLTEAKPADG